MDYKILWHPRARHDLQLLYRYLSDRAPNAANRTISEISTRIKLLITNPHLAAIDSLLADHIKTYRSLIVGNYKIVYIVENTEIIIVCIWDCRRNPEKFKKSLK